MLVATAIEAMAASLREAASAGRRSPSSIGPYRSKVHVLHAGWIWCHNMCSYKKGLLEFMQSWCKFWHGVCIAGLGLGNVVIGRLSFNLSISNEEEQLFSQ